MNYYGSEGFYFKTSGYSLVCYTAVFSVVTQRSSPLSGEERCVTVEGDGGFYAVVEVVE